MGITLQNITKTYDKAKQPVLNDVNAEIQDGELFVIVGPSGCGKSTLLRMIAGIIPITSGKLAINGQIMNAVPPKDRKLSMVFQSYALYPFWTWLPTLRLVYKHEKCRPRKSSVGSMPR